MFKDWVLKDFLEKTQWEGGFEAMVHYCGRVNIIDDPEFEKAWNRFVIDYEYMEQFLEEEPE